VDLVREDESSMPIDPYGISKRLAEGEAFGSATDKMSVVVLRPALVYGPGMKGNLSSLLEFLRKRHKVPLPEVNNRRSLVGLQDLVRCTLLAAERSAAVGQTYVVTDGEAYSTERIVRALADGIGVDPTPRIRVPLGALRMAASLGDGLERVSGRRVPLNSGLLTRLLGNAEYESGRAVTHLEYRPSQILEDVGHALAASSLSPEHTGDLPALPVKGPHSV
jgi:nucleoside-diphosphate-sugar epimerase